MSFDAIAERVLAHYPTPLIAGPRHSLGNHGGFSGARLWRIDQSAGPLCLRAWPAGETTERLSFIHRAMIVARNHGLAFVPAVYTTLSGATSIMMSDRIWDLTSWLSGRADDQEPRSPQRVTAACSALAQLHNSWSQLGCSTGPCPAVQRRIVRVHEWLTLLASGWRPAFAGSGADPARPWAERLWQGLQGRVERLPALLAPWEAQRFALQLCLCDVWHAHVLFDHDIVTGVIDFGSVKSDHVSVDLARLLGSLVDNAATLWTAGFEAYRRVRSLTVVEQELAHVLDQTGVLLAAANWLRWLYHDHERRFEDREAVAGRLAVLVRRLSLQDR